MLLIKPFLTTPQSASQTAPLTRGAEMSVVSPDKGEPKTGFFDRLRNRRYVTAISFTRF